MKREMININLPRYGTRMLQAGDSFEANRRDARLLHALKKARYVEDGDTEAESPAITPPKAPVAAPPKVEAPAADEELQKLRADYQKASGKKPFHGWDAATLRDKIIATSSDVE